MFDTGIIATEALTGYLFENGQAQTAFDLLSSDKETSLASYLTKSWPKASIIIMCFQL